MEGACIVTIRLELSHRICRNAIEVQGTKGMKVTYCQRTLTTVDDKGRPAHPGPCSIHPDPKKVAECPHGKASVGNCLICRGKL
jgi:hypothetical protein